MKSNKPDAAQIWKQLDDLLVPRLRLSITERGVYSHLLRHSHLEGRAVLRFSLPWLARGARVSTNPARRAVRRLIAHGALRLLKRNNAGHVSAKIRVSVHVVLHLQVIKQNRNRSRENCEARGRSRQQGPIKPGNRRRTRFKARQHRRPEVPPWFPAPHRRQTRLEQLVDSFLIVFIHGSIPCRFSSFRRKRRARKTRTFIAPIETPNASAISW